jgi:hypothetical protein
MEWASPNVKRIFRYGLRAKTLFFHSQPMEFAGTPTGVPSSSDPETLSNVCKQHASLRVLSQHLLEKRRNSNVLKPHSPDDTWVAPQHPKQLEQ